MAEIFKKLTNRKAPGPNGLNLELFKYRTILLEQTLLLFSNMKKLSTKTIA
jgi:hypothetical protein